MTSEKKTTANRKNAKSSSGPRSDAGKAKSAANARRHGFSARVLIDATDIPLIQSLAEALLDTMPRSEVMQELALEAARAQHAVYAIRAHRQRLFEGEEGNPQNFRGPNLRRDTSIIVATLKAHERGQTDLGSQALQDLFFRWNREAPRDHVRRHCELLLVLTDELDNLARYEARALARRRRAFQALDRCAALGCVSRTEGGAGVADGMRG